MNPFFEDYGTPHNAVPFDKIKISDFEEAFMEGIRRDKESLDKIINNPDKPTFDNTIIFNDESKPDHYYDLLDRAPTPFRLTTACSTFRAVKSPPPTLHRASTSAPATRSPSGKHRSTIGYHNSRYTL